MTSIRSSISLSISIVLRYGSRHLGMHQTVEIVEVKGRAIGGFSSAPFRCRGEDGLEYYVKLGNAHPRGKVAEWVCGQLAQLMKLPIADFGLVKVSRDLAEHLPTKSKELGHGVGFGSVSAPVGHRELRHPDVGMIEPTLLAEILVFDLWILNEDRKLGPAGGNPNALWVPGTDEPLLLIDHDNGFDTEFSQENFLKEHFAEPARGFWLESSRRNNWTERALNAASQLKAIWSTIPEEWLMNWHGDPLPVPELNSIEKLLNRPTVSNSDFWELLKR